MIHSKNQMIRSMKSYQMGGSSDDSCMEIVMVDGKPKKRKKQKCNAGKTKRVFSGKEIAKGTAKVLGTAAALTGAYLADKKYGLVDKAKEALGLKKGGAVKRIPKKQMGGMTEGMCGPGDGCHKSSKKANRKRLSAAGVSRKTQRRM